MWCVRILIGRSRRYIAAENEDIEDLASAISVMAILSKVHRYYNDCLKISRENFTD